MNQNKNFFLIILKSLIVLNSVKTQNCEYGSVYNGSSCIR